MESYKYIILSAGAAGSTMSNIIMFLLNHYEFYFYLSACCIGAVIAYLLLRIRKPQLFSVKMNCIVMTGSFLANSFASILLTHHLRIFDELNDPRFAMIFLKLSAAIIFGAVFIPFFILPVHLAMNKADSKIIIRYRYGIIIFAVTFIHFVSNLPSKLDSWSSVWYATDYSMGIGSRFFIGSFLRLFHKGYLEEKTAYHFCVGALVILIAITSFLLNEAIAKAEEKHRTATAFIVLCFIAGPGYISAMWVSKNMGRLETYTFLLSLLSVIIFTMVQNAYVRYTVITLLSCISMAIYQGYLFMYYPIILMLIVWDCLSVHEHRMRNRLLGFASTIITGISFIFFQFFSFTYFENAEEMIAAIREGSNITIEQSAIDLELFQSIATAYDTTVPGYIYYFSAREKTFLIMFLLTPLIILITALYLKCREVRKEKKENILSNPYIYYLLFNLAIVPQFVLNIDWGRWMTALHIILFFGILYLCYQKDSGMLAALDALSAFLNRHWFMSLMVIPYLAGISKFMALDFIAEADTLMSFLSKFFL